MKKLFAVAVDDLSPEDERKISETFNKDYSWWHWIKGFWLVIDTTNALDVIKIREMVHEVDATVNCIVLELPDSVFWAAYGPKSKKRDMFKWLDNNI